MTTITFRIDSEVEKALAALTASGVSRSEAVRAAIRRAAREQLYDEAAADARRVMTSETDRAEVARIQAEMDDLRAW